MGIGTAAGWSTNDRLVQQFIGSFRRVTDPAVLNVKPNRISIATVSKATTLAEFNRQKPSVIPIEELALINGLADGNAALAAGTTVKRVVGM
jgi:predicted Zn-dependent protease